ncbi:hypothetical protein [Acidihalobacter ferrooxydans]|uniref:Metallo-beta-lactamase domain-containing protein n=1 Tax=Acidihalobacter ferrooxydans TaxID=1765967 RepID=A0A1P8UDS1_9GAMM|nr:hypothetical protein [Acidihalobacter ferrooxydans]APZ42011.1 hypothetical protein BW247_01950 [Acidihalobacter ferrooxydans]
MLQELVSLRDRTLYYLSTVPAPAVYYIADKKAEGVLVNTPPFDAALLDALQAVAPLRYIFLPSARGARDLDRWRTASGAESISSEPEAAAIAGTIDITLDSKRNKLTRTIDFLPMSGVTAGTCAMRLKNKPGAVFFGPALEPGPDGWPTLIPHADDYCAESRLFGSLGVQDLVFDYAFTDTFVPGRTQYGPGAEPAVKAALERVLDD